MDKQATDLLLKNAPMQAVAMPHRNMKAPNKKTFIFQVHPSIVMKSNHKITRMPAPIPHGSRLS